MGDLSNVDEDRRPAIDRSLEDEMVRPSTAPRRGGQLVGAGHRDRAQRPPAGSHVQWDEKLDGRLAQAVMSIHAVKAVEIGAGIAGSQGFGSAAHDPIAREGDRWVRASNHAGGLEGGITNGEDLVITAYKEPIATLRKGMPSVDLDTMEPRASQYERSDVTALPAAGVIAEAMASRPADALSKLGGDSLPKSSTLARRSLRRRAWPTWPQGRSDKHARLVSWRIHHPVDRPLV